MNIAGGAIPEYHLKNKKFVEFHLSCATVLASPSKRIIDHFSNTSSNLTIEYLPNFIDLSLFPRSAERNFNFSVLWVRAFRHIYNPLIAIEAIELLVEEFPEIHLTMIGPDGGLLENCKSYIKQHNLNNHISIKGSIQNKDLSIYYQSHDVFINTTSFESFGFALIEAASCGLPIVSSNVGEIPILWTNKKNILLFEDKNPQMLANKLKCLFTDYNLRKQIADNGHSLSQQFGWEPFQAKFLTLLDQAK
jgi:glycosyltransferase involved in cell wall biosynthesis